MCKMILEVRIRIFGNAMINAYVIYKNDTSSIIKVKYFRKAIVEKDIHPYLKLCILHPLKNIVTVKKSREHVLLLILT